MIDFYRQHKVKIIMLTPLLVGVLFFSYSTISAFITVETSNIPEKLGQISMNINNYEIQQIDEHNNQVKWILKAESAQTSTDETKAKISKPYLVFFADGKEQFTITASKADLDKGEQKVNLYENVVLETKDGSYKISSNRMIFDEADPYVEFLDNWNIENNSGYEIKGKKGKLSKDKKTIISENDATLVQKKGKQGIVLEANKIIVKAEEAMPIRASSNAKLVLGPKQNLSADVINIAKNGTVKANGNVSVITEKLTSRANNLEIFPNPDKSPSYALLTGNPSIIQNKSTIYADQIKYDFATQSAHIEGHIHSGS